MRLMLLFTFLLILANANNCDNSASCKALKEIESIQTDKKPIYDDQNTKIKNLKKLNAKYLLNLTGVNFYTTKEVKFIHIWQQVDLQVAPNGVFK
ncbi:hypothetical protein [Helicobacter sp. T3_23-1059]